MDFSSFAQYANFFLNAILLTGGIYLFVALRRLYRARNQLLKEQLAWSQQREHAVAEDLAIMKEKYETQYKTALAHMEVLKERHQAKIAEKEIDIRRLAKEKLQRDHEIKELQKERAFNAFHTLDMEINSLRLESEALDKEIQQIRTSFVERATQIDNWENTLEKMTSLVDVLSDSQVMASLLTSMDEDETLRDQSLELMLRLKSAATVWSELVLKGKWAAVFEELEDAARKDEHSEK